MSASALFQASSGLALPCSMETSALPMALPISPACGPRICGFRFLADSEKIFPAGALLKNGLLNPATSGWSHSALSDGKLPLLVNSHFSCSGAVSHLASSTASFWWALAVGTVRYEPPQLPPPVPGILARSHLPAVSGALSLMYAIIQDGHVTVANWPFWNPVFHC